MSRACVARRVPLAVRVRGDNGIALVVTMLAVMLLAALGGALVTVMSTETDIAANVEDGVQTLEAARSAAELAIGELSVAADWHAVLLGQISSSLTDGPAGPRALPDAGALDLTAESGRLNCGQPRPCLAGEVAAVTTRRPWGPNNPTWVLFAHGPLADLLPAGARGPLPYVAVWVADDPSEADDDPQTDGGGPPGANPGAGLLWLHAEAWGARGSRRQVDASVARDSAAPMGLRLRSWTEGT